MVIPATPTPDGGSGLDTLAMSTGCEPQRNLTGTIAGFEALQLSASVTMTAATFKAGFAANTMLTGVGGLALNMDAADGHAAAPAVARDERAVSVYDHQRIVSAANTVMAASGFGDHL